MAAPIARIRRLDGSAQFDASALTFQLIGKGTVAVGARQGGNTTPGSALIPIPSASTTRILAVRSSFVSAKAGTVTLNGQAYAHYACAVSSGTVEYWLFDLARTLSASRFGLTMRNPSTGEMTYSSDYDVFRRVSRITGVGQSAALDGAKSYAVAQQDFAGHRRTPDNNSYIINGAPTIWDGSSRLASTTWAYNNDGKLYGAAVNGGTVTTGMVSWDDVRASLGTGSRPADFPPNWARQIVGLVVDVTGL